MTKLIAKRTTKTAIRKAQAAARKLSRAALKLEQAVETGTAPVGTEFVKNEIKYVVRAFGLERVPTKDKPVTREEVIYLLTNVRMLEKAEILEMVGKNVLRYMVEKDYLRVLDNAEQFWVTTKAQAAYALPNPRLSTGISAAYLK